MPVITNITQISHICFLSKDSVNTVIQLKKSKFVAIVSWVRLRNKICSHAHSTDKHFSDKCWVIISLQVYVRSYFYNFQIFKKAYPTSSHNIFIFSQLMSVVVHDVQLLPLLNARGLLSWGWWCSDFLSWKSILRGHFELIFQLGTQKFGLLMLNGMD